MKAYIAIISLLFILAPSKIFSQRTNVLDAPLDENTDVTSLRVITLKAGFSTSNGSNKYTFSAKINSNYIAPTPSINLNYIEEITYNYKSTVGSASKVGDKQHTIQYFDGLGRPLQTVNYAGTPDGTDIISPRAYDEAGRETVGFLPYTDSKYDGSYRDCIGQGYVNQQAYAYGDQYLYYTNGKLESVEACSTPYSITVFDNSPLNRVKEQGAPGNTWQPGQHTIKTEYGPNPANDVYKFTISGNTLVKSGTYYPEGILYLTITQNENWTSGGQNTVREYKDIEGRVILKRTYDSNSNQINTYYVYDDFGLLRYVISPMGFDKIKPSIAGSKTYTDTEIDQYCYYYQYDARKRMIIKKLPGAEAICMAYDLRDRLVLTQDGVQRAKTSKEWTFFKYDDLNRLVMTGVYYDNRGLGDVLYVIKNSATSEYRNNTLLGYSNQSFPTIHYNNSSAITQDDVLSVNYYDDYSAIDGGYEDATNITATPFYRLKNKPTVTMHRILDTDQFTKTITFYDIYGRVIETQTLNNIGEEVSANEYNFAGWLTKNRQTQKVTIGTSVLTNTTLNTNIYDHTGRVTDVKQQFNSNTEVTLAQMEYNDLGQLKSKKLNGASSPVQSIDYTYNIRGWLKKINNPSSVGDDKFTEELFYTENVTGVAGESQYNGNLSGMKWTRSDKTIKGYGFRYDALNRLTEAKYAEGSSLSTYQDRHSMTTNTSTPAIRYDKNGNITALTRYGYISSASGYGVIDDLSYRYVGNQVKGIGDSRPDQGGRGDFFDFVDGNSSEEYFYDNNGNMTKDLNQSFIINYNRLNLPSSVSSIREPSAGTLTYQYNSAGVKLKESLVNENTYYFNNMIYDNNGLKNVLHAEGCIVVLSGSSSVNQYFIKDHLGNVRVVMEGSTVKQENEYDPFGLKFNYDDDTKPASNDNRYLYNGKEIQNKLGLNMYDYGARFYDPMIGRWHSIDPMIELHYDYSPFAYVYNNPIRLIDPFGCDSASNAFLDQMVQGFIKQNPNIHATVDGKVVNEGNESKNDGDQNNIYKGFICVSDVTGWVGNTDATRKLAGLKKLGKSGQGLKWYGESFYGNQYTKIKLGKTLKVAGGLITSLQLSADIGAILSGLKEEERNKAFDKLINDALMAGIFVVSGEVGMIVTIFDAANNTPEMQQFRNELKAKKEFNIPSGPLYFNQSKKK